MGASAKRWDTYKRLLVLLLSLIVLFSFSGCFLSKLGVKDYSLEERRAAVMKHLENKYGEEFKEIAVEPAGLMYSYDAFHMYPKSKTKEDQFIVHCRRSENGLSISDGYFGILIHDEYEKLMNDIIDEFCDEYFLMVSTQPDIVWNDRYNRDTQITDLYRKGEDQGFQSLVPLHIKESALSNLKIEDMLQLIGETMLEQKLKGTIWADVIKDDRYDELKGKTLNEIRDLTNKNLRDFFVYPSNKISPTYSVSIIEDESSGNLVIKYSAE